MHKVTGNILSWTRRIEPQAEQQLRNIAGLPIIYKHIAVMPDVHLGKGATVGSVIATEGAIIPAAVGVDIGCFSGDTLVPLADGKAYPIKMLAEESRDLVVYACTPSGRIVAAKASAKKTRKAAALLEIGLDNGLTIRCTPDHKFMLRDGTYRQATELTPDTSLMPFYQQIDPEGYVRVKQPYSERWQRAHWIIARSGLLGKIHRYPGQRTVIHHKNFDEADNRPENLEFMGNHDHSSYHRSLVERNVHWQSAEFEEKRRRALHLKSKTPEGYQYYASRGTKNILKYMSERRGHFKAAVAGNGERGKMYLQKYNQSEKGRAKSKEIANRWYTCESCQTQVRSGLGIHNHRKWEHGYNHSVAWVKPLHEVEDVYCLTVPEYGNFALAAGVFVHNCGMIAVRTRLSAAELPDDLHALRIGIERRIPLGAGRANATPSPAAERFFTKRPPSDRVADALRKKAVLQYGSLGSGNHFIEVCLDTADRVWLVLHSGSRGVGNQLAEYHIRKAKGLVREYFNQRLPDPDLAWLVQDTPAFDAYVEDLLWCQDYAFANRHEMMNRVLAELSCAVYGGEGLERQLEVERTNCHHNFTQRETHFGKEVWLTRKGAIQAKAGQPGIIPGSMGTRTYIVKGKGHPLSYESCSHGAGRQFSRGEARRRFTMDDFQRQMAGVECRHSPALIDELPSAYKDIDQVMEEQRNLVDIVDTLKQIVSVKGD